jgi:hypothetical protein
MARIFRFLFGTGTRTVVTLSGFGALLVLGHFRPDLIHSVAFWVTDRISTALSRLIGAIFGGAGAAFRQHSGFFDQIFEMVIIIGGLILLFRAIFGKKKKKS